MRLAPSTPPFALALAFALAACASTGSAPESAPPAPATPAPAPVAESPPAPAAATTPIADAAPAASPAPAPAPIPPPEDFVHPRAGFRFPGAIGALRREPPHHYPVSPFERERLDPDNLSCNYEGDPSVWVTVYCYPVQTQPPCAPVEDDPETEEDEVAELRRILARGPYEFTKDVLRARFVGLEEISEAPVELQWNGERHPGWHLVFRYEEERDGRREAVVSEFIDFPLCGDWHVKFRWSRPEAAAAAPDSAPFLRAFGVAPASR
jgi:hypothetical protein